VITQHNYRAIAQRFNQAQHVQRIRAAINQITDEPQLIFRCVKWDFLQQLLEFGVTTLDVADCVDGHI
jgi:hypothetical protein